MGTEFEAKIEQVSQDTKKLERAMRTAFLGENIQLHIVVANFHALLQGIINNKNILAQYPTITKAQELKKESTIASLQVYLDKVNLILERPDIDLRGKDLVTFDYGVYRLHQNK